MDQQHVITHITDYSTKVYIFSNMWIEKTRLLEKKTQYTVLILNSSPQVRCL